MDGKEGNYKFKTTRGQRRQFGWSRKRSVLSTDAEESLAWVIFVMEIFRNKENCPADKGQLCLLLTLLILLLTTHGGIKSKPANIRSVSKTDCFQPV